MWWLMIACAAPDEGGLAPAQEMALQAALEQGVEDVGAPGATMAVRIAGVGAWAGAAGEVDRLADLPAEAGDVYALGSITKTFTATLILQLIEEGVLELDAPASTWVPAAPYADRYTLRQLLAHQTGLVDFVSDLSFIGGANQPWTHQETLALIAEESLQFEPGSAHDYCNSNYAVLGWILEVVTGGPWGVEARAQLLDPLGLAELWVPSAEAHPPLNPGHIGEEDVSAEYDPSAPGAAGEMVGAAPDVAAWGEALLLGGVLSAPSRELLHTMPAPNEDYGHGVQVWEYPADEVVLLGHSGSTIGYQTRMSVHLASGTVVVTLLNDLAAEADRIDQLAWEALGVLSDG